MNKTSAVFLSAAIAAFGLRAQGATKTTVTPAMGPPSTSITVTGTGFDPSTLIDVFFDTTDVALKVSSATGAVSIALPVAASAQPGVHWVTLSERKNYNAAQAAFTVSTDWPQGGFNQSKRGYNPYENTIGTGNAGQLSRLWSKPLDGFGNSKPPVVVNDIIYVRDANQVVRAFNKSGTLLWKASTPFESFPDSLTPAAGFGKVFFADYNGNIIAYKQGCRTDGGTCAPSWTANIGKQIAGGLTLRNNLLYAPAQDGRLHVINAQTGAKVTSLAVGTGDALTSWIAFAADGSGFVAHGTRMVETAASAGGSTSDVSYSGTLSSPIVGGADTAYATANDATLNELQYGWNTSLGGAGCTTPAAFANGLVFAAGCTTVGAYDTGTGGTAWSSTISGSQGLAVANGVLYACNNSRLVAYAAQSGTKLWTGGYCSAAPVIVNGILYATYSNLGAYSLTGAQSARMPARPDPRMLKRNPALKVTLADRTN